MRINLLVHVALTSCNTEVLDDFGLYSVLMEIFFSPLQAKQAYVKDVWGNIFAVSKVKVNFVYPVHVFAINDYSTCTVYYFDYSEVTSFKYMLDFLFC